MERFLCVTFMDLDLRYRVLCQVLCNPLKLCFKETNSAGFKWSFNRCIRSSQEPSGQIAQKFQAKYGSENRCLNTASRFDQIGSILMLYPCERIHPVNGCFKFKENPGRCLSFYDKDKAKFRLTKSIQNR